MGCDQLLVPPATVFDGAFERVEIDANDTEAFGVPVPPFEIIEQGPDEVAAQVDTAEQVYISSLALLKMLKHGERATRATNHRRVDCWI